MAGPSNIGESESSSRRSGRYRLYVPISPDLRLRDWALGVQLGFASGQGLRQPAAHDRNTHAIPPFTGTTWPVM